MGRRTGRDGGTTIVLKREEAAGHAHHGGAWKVAYADFVTAMMAFFLLMWLLNATSKEQRRGLADYFAPANVFGRSTSGTGQPFGGKTLNSEGELASDAGAIRVERGPEFDGRFWPGCVRAKSRSAGCSCRRPTRRAASGPGEMICTGSGAAPGRGSPAVTMPSS